MRVLFNHGITAEELYTNMPPTVFQKKWSWLIKNGCSNMTYQEAISDPFKYGISIIMNKVIDDKVRFLMPVIGSTYIDFEVVLEEDFMRHRRYGRFQNIDIINSDFTGYSIRYYFSNRAYQKSFQFYLGGELKSKFLEKINSGEKFYSIKNITIKDIIPELHKKFPNFTKKELKNLMVFGLKRMHAAIRYGCGITISTNKYSNCYFFIGALYSDPKRQVRNYVAKRDKKLRILHKWNETKWDNYYYIGLSPGAFEKWVENNKTRRTLVEFNNVILRKIQEEIYSRDREVYLFKVKMKKPLGWTHREETLIYRNPEYIGKTVDWKFIPSTLTWKELIKEYEAGTS